MDFEEAAHAVSRSKGISTQHLLSLYGLFKAATLGPNTAAEPGYFEFQARAKWFAWTDVSHVSQTQAKIEYIRLASSLLPPLIFESSNNINVPGSDMTIDESASNLPGDVGDRIVDGSLPIPYGDCHNAELLQLSENSFNNEMGNFEKNDNDSFSSDYGMHVSTMIDGRKFVEYVLSNGRNSEMSIFQWAEEGNLEMVRSLLDAANMDALDSNVLSFMT